MIDYSGYYCLISGQVGEILSFLEKHFQGVQSTGIEEVLTAFRSPWQNAFVERFNGSIRRECTDHIIVLGGNHLRRILKSFFEYYHDDRTHLGLEKEPRNVQS